MPTQRDESASPPDPAPRLDPPGLDAARVDLAPLRELVIRLRAPDGCPWDQEQTLDDLRAYLLEEAHEVAAAIIDDDRPALAEELGDLLFQVVFVARLAEEEGSFHLHDAIEGIHRKMVERHPHVFGEADPELVDARSVARAWARRKAEKNPERSLLDGVPSSLPALTAAQRLTAKAAGIGFDWPAVPEVLEKVREELAEIEEALDEVERAQNGTDDRQPQSVDRAETARRHLEEEVGDLLFAVANLARHLELDPELTLARANAKFERRFRAVEADFRARDEPLAEASLAEMDAAWERAKRGS